MDTEVIKKYYSNIKKQLENELVNRSDVFVEYQSYLQPFVTDGNLDAILQYSSVMIELNYNEEEIIEFLLSYQSQFLETKDNHLKVRFYINLAFYYLASDRHFDNVKILEYLQTASKYQETAQAYSLLAYYYYHNHQMELAKDNYQNAIQLEDNEIDYLNYKQLDIYLNELSVKDNLSVSRFKDEDNIELVLELQDIKKLQCEDLCIMLKCNLMDCVIHRDYR